MNTKKLLIILLVAVLLVVYYLLGTGYLKQRQEHKILIPRIAEAAQTLALIPLPPPDLEQRLAAAQADLTAGQSALPGEVNSTRTIDAILKLADECDVKAVPLVTEPWTAVKIGSHDYDVFRLSVSVTGSFANLVSFTGKLENEGFETLILEALSVSRTLEQPGEETVPEGEIPVTASLELAVYTLSPIEDEGADQ